MTPREAQDGVWYTVQPYRTEYSDPFDLLNHLGDGFVFVMAKGVRDVISLFCKARPISATRFGVVRINEVDLIMAMGEKPLAFQYSVRSVMPLVGEDAKRSAASMMYECFSAPESRMMALVVEAHKMAGGYTHPAVLNYMRKRPSLKSKMTAKTAYPLYVCKVFALTQDGTDAIAVQKDLPAGFTMWHRRPVKIDTVWKTLHGSVRKPGVPSVAGQLMSALGSLSVKDTLLNKLELSTIVQIPRLPQEYSMDYGTTPARTQGFDVADVESEKEPWEN